MDDIPLLDEYKPYPLYEDYVKKVQFKVCKNACITYGEVVFYLKEIEQIKSSI